MNLGEKSATSITICGKSNTDNNTINIKFFETDNSSTTQIIEFANTDDYEEEREHNRRERERRERAKQKNKRRTEYINEWNED